MKTLINNNSEGRTEAIILIVFYIIVFGCIIIAS